MKEKTIYRVPPLMVNTCRRLPASGARTLTYMHFKRRVALCNSISKCVVEEAINLR